MIKNDKTKGSTDIFDLPLLRKATIAWECMATFREDRERNKRFTYGDQWGDPVPVDGGIMREEDYIRSQGNIPLKNNLIRRLVRNVLGVYRDRWKNPVATKTIVTGIPVKQMNRLLSYNSDLNRLEEIYARSMEEFLISGLAIHKKWYGTRNRITDCWTDIVPPETFFADSDARDCRGWDFTMLGEIHEMDRSSLYSAFASSPQDMARLNRIFAETTGDKPASGNRFGYGKSEYSNPENARIKILEIWTRETAPAYRCHDPKSGRYFDIPAESFAKIEEENLSRNRGREPLIKYRWLMSETWRYKFLSSAGHVIESGISPYSHGMHPYVIKAYPFLDGEIHSFVSDIIDQQKFTNRLISMYDWILRSSAKGVLLFPEGALPQGVDINDVAEEWSRFNGVIVFKPRPGIPLPQQVSSNAANIGITELLNIQMKMMEDISGVNGALQGRLDNTSVSGTLYDRQTRNSLTALADLLKTFEEFISEATGRDISNISQFYTPAKISSILNY